MKPPATTHNPFDPGYYLSEELRAFGFARVGEGSAIARNCTIIGLENITVGDHVRIDGYTSLIAASGSIRIGSQVHVGSHCLLGGRGGITLEDFASLSHGVRILSAIDDFSGRSLTNSTLPAHVLNVRTAPVVVGRYVPVGTGSVLLPGAAIGEGAAVAALSLVTGPLAPWRIHAGNPVRDMGPRARDLLALAAMIEPDA